MENGEFGMSAGVAAKCPPKWLLALGGGSGGDLLDLECPDNLQRGTTGDTPAACTWISVSAPVVPATSLQPAVNEEPAVNVFEEVEF